MARKKKRGVKQKPQTLKEKRETTADEERLFLKKDLFICSAVFVGTLMVYILTLAPTVYFGDSGELTAAAYNLGIAHPPGYPLYLLLGKLFMIMIPFGDMAMRLNLLSAVFAALTAVMIYLINRQLAHERFISVSVSLTAAFSFTFWSQAVVAEVYTLAALFFCSMIFLTLMWLKVRKEKWLLAMAFTAGLALTHHVIIAVFYPVFLIFILLNRPHPKMDWKSIAKATVLFLLPLLLYLYLPLSSSSNPLNDWGNPESVSAMAEHITAKQFGGLFLKYGLDGVWFQLNVFIDTLLNQYPFFLFIFVVIGVTAGLNREKQKTLLFLVLVLVAVTYSSAYFITDIEPHFIPVFLILALFIGMGFDYLYRLLKRAQNPRLHRLGAAALTILALLPLGFNWTTCDQSDNYLARNYGRNMIHPLEKNAVLFIDGEAELFVAAYFKIVETLRPDVEVYDVRQNIFFIPKIKEKGKKDATIADLYAFALEKIKEERPVYFTNPIFEDLRYREFGLLYQVVPPGGFPGGPKDPWNSYNLSKLEKTHTDPHAKETAGKYFLSRAKYLARTNQPGLSGQFLEKALAAAGDSYPVLKQICIYYMERNRHSKAERLLKKAVKLNPFDPDAFNMLAMIAHYRLAFQDALENYDQALAIKRGHISSLMNRGRLYEQLGDRETNPEIKKEYYRKALNDLDRSKDIEPSNPGIDTLKERISYKLSR
jgi:tetratricopeptide (TPR) repeat protein